MNIKVKVFDSAEEYYYKKNFTKFKQLIEKLWGEVDLEVERVNECIYDCCIVSG